MSADLAKTIAEAALARSEAGRERRTLALGWDALGVVPGACVAIAGTPGVYRVASWSFEKMVLTLECVRLAGATAAASASPGRMLPAPDLVAGTTILEAVELPPLDDAVLSAPRLTVMAAGTGEGWRRAALLYSLDRGAHWSPAGATTGVATLGVLASVPGMGSAELVDRINAFEVELAHEGMALSGADEAALDGGANIALVGDELLQFGSATQIGPTRWRLSLLLWGRRGTETAIGTQAVGERFVLIEAAAASVIALPLASMGSVATVLASGIGDEPGPVSRDVVVTGRSVLPLAPVHLTATVLPDGDMRVCWIRRSRAGWRWIDGAETPVGEDRELYRVTLLPAGGAARTIETMVAELVVPASERAGGALTVQVRQAGTHGESPPREIILPAL